MNSFINWNTLTSAVHQLLLFRVFYCCELFLWVSKKLILNNYKLSKKSFPKMLLTNCCSQNTTVFMMVVRLELVTSKHCSRCWLCEKSLVQSNMLVTSRGQWTNLMQKTVILHSSVDRSLRLLCLTRYAHLLVHLGMWNNTNDFVLN